MYAFGEFETLSNPGSNREKGTPPMKKKNIRQQWRQRTGRRLWRTGHGPGSKSGYRSCLRTKSRSFWVGKSRSGARIGKDTGTVTGNRDASQ